MKLLRLFIPLMIVVPLLSADRIAILPFTPEGIDSTQAKTFTDRIRTALVGYSQFDVMEREKLQAIIEEQEMSLTGLCDEECIIEVGQIANVQYMVSGNIRNLGQAIYLGARIIDVETSKVMSEQDLTVPSNDLNALLDAAPDLADAVMQQFVEKKGLTNGGSMAIVDDSEMGKLRLSVSQLGVQLIIDGKSKGTISRKDIVVQLAPGQHSIQILKEGFESYSTTVAIQPKSTTTREVTINPSGEAIEEIVDWSILTISSTPSEAMVVIDGIEYGQSFIQLEIAPGKHTIQMSKPLYYSYIKEINLEPGDIGEVEADLKPNFGSITLASVPPDARIMLNDRQELQKTPYTVTPIQSGQYSLVLSLDDYRDYKQDITISDGIETKIDAQLTPAFGWLTINSNPDDADILVDGREIGKSPLQKYRLPSGDYVLTVKRDFYKEYQELINISDGENLSMDLSLMADFGQLSVQGFPKGASITLDGEFRGVIPALIEPIGVGSHSMIIDAGPHYKKHSQEIFINLNDITGVQVNLKELTGSLIASTNPPGADIIIDGKPFRSLVGGVAKTPYTIPKLWVGEHQISLRLEGHAPSNQTIIIKEDKREALLIELDKLIYLKPRGEALWRSAIVPGFGQLYEERPLWAFVYIVTEASLLISLNNQRTDYAKLHQEYLDKRDAYSNFQGSNDQIAERWAEVQTAFDVSEANYQKQQITMGLMAGVYVWNIADAWMFMPRRTESNWSTGLISDGRSVSAQVKLNLP
jgi:TolB-like protein